MLWGRWGAVGQEGKFSFSWHFGEDRDTSSGRVAVCWVSAFFLRVLHLSPLPSISQLTVTAPKISLLPMYLLSRGFSLLFFLQLDNFLSKIQPRHHSCATAKASLGSQAASWTSGLLFSIWKLAAHSHQNKGKGTMLLSVVTPRLVSHWSLTWAFLKLWLGQVRLLDTSIFLVPSRSSG